MKMIRSCYLCGSKSLECVFSTTWALPGLPPKEIGFSVCTDCGSVCQSPTVTFDEMMQFYSSIAVYTNPGRQEKPSEAKIRDLDEQIQFIKRGIGNMPLSALQIGSSDGYTLSRFRDAGVEKVLGVEPGTASIEMADRLYKVPCIHGSAETFETNDTFELILLTHVLEHLYEPQKVLAKCRKIQNGIPDGYIYIEVPLMTKPSSLCPGFFSFEHINYYTKENLLKSLKMADYYPISAVEHFNSNLSPVIGILASTKKQNHYDDYQSSVDTNKKILNSYRGKELDYWQSCLDKIAEKLKISSRIFIWGAGIHTSQLVANTNLIKHYKIDGLTDTSPLKWGLKQGIWTCQDPNEIDWMQGDTVLISSYASEKEIYDALQWLRDRNVETLRLHNVNDTRAH
ncbi:class I SAM-dependent methyltransferase [Pseudidiomarina sp.]|uniref:class I SAM-dependent methyltransferase n=1 Tax=Pseudidiomarina sp. TaxID=2081707 RepID=UPI003A978B82